MKFEDVEITETEYRLWLEGIDLEGLKWQLSPAVWQTFVENKQKQIRGDRIDRLLALVDSWIDAMYSGAAVNRQPDLDARPLPSREDVDGFKHRIQKFFHDELYIPGTDYIKKYWRDRGITETPDWSLLDESGWLAFYQDYYRLKNKLMLEKK